MPLGKISRGNSQVLRAMTPRRDILRLYKDVLRACKTFPSSNRQRLYKEIQFDFRKNVNVTDEAKIEAAVALGQKGLAQLRMYDFPKGQSNISVKLEEEPMPRPKPKE